MPSSSKNVLKTIFDLSASVLQSRNQEHMNCYTEIYAENPIFSDVTDQYWIWLRAGKIDFHYIRLAIAEICLC